MIILIEHGRLGNQLFQYATLKSTAQDEQLYLVGFDALRVVFDGIEAKFPTKSNSLIYRLLKKTRPHLNHLLGTIPLFNYVKEYSSENKRYLKYKSGFISQVAYCDTLFCQSEDFFNPSVIDSLKIKSHFLQKAKEKLDLIYSHDQTPIFVHVRRGDYCRWPSVEAPAILPANWYNRCITEMQQRYENPFFIFTSDDVPYLKDLFSKLENSIISEGTQEEDFALMTLCQGGILSASSFSWWAAYFAHREHGGGVFFAPWYWAGHRINKWHPSLNIKSSFLEYISVK